MTVPRAVGRKPFQLTARPCRWTVLVVGFRPVRCHASSLTGGPRPSSLILAWSLPWPGPVQVPALRPSDLPPRCSSTWAPRESGCCVGRACPEESPWPVHDHVPRLEAGGAMMYRSPVSVETAGNAGRPVRWTRGLHRAGSRFSRRKSMSGKHALVPAAPSRTVSEDTLRLAATLRRGSLFSGATC